MAKDKVPSVGALDKPESLDDLLKQDRGEDCLPCRVIGQYTRHLLSLPIHPLQDGAGSPGLTAFSLRVPTGGGAFIGLAAYSYFSGNAQLERQRAKILASKSMFGVRSRKLGIATTSLGLAWLGIWRLFL